MFASRFGWHIYLARHSFFFFARIAYAEFSEKPPQLAKGQNKQVKLLWLIEYERPRFEVHTVLQQN